MNELEFKIAEHICTLNSWNTPYDIGRELQRPLNRERGEFRIALASLEALVPKHKWIKVWNNEITAPTTEASQ